jgi:hypothetical protein
MRVFLLIAMAACAENPGGPGGGDTGTDGGASEPQSVGSGTMGLTCEETGCAATQYCESTWGTSELGNAVCVDLPAACQADPTCACLLAEGTCTSCEDDAASGLAWCTD